MSETLLSLVGVGKSFKEVNALTHVDLEIDCSIEKGFLPKRFSEQAKCLMFLYTYGVYQLAY